MIQNRKRTEIALCPFWLAHAEPHPTEASFQRVILSEVEVLVSERSETIQNHEQREVGSTNTAAVPFRVKVTFDKGQTFSDAIQDPAERRPPFVGFDYANVTP